MGVRVGEGRRFGVGRGWGADMGKCGGCTQTEARHRLQHRPRWAHRSAHLQCTSVAQRTSLPHQATLPSQHPPCCPRARTPCSPALAPLGSSTRVGKVFRPNFSVAKSRSTSACRAGAGGGRGAQQARLSTPHPLPIGREGRAHASLLHKTCQVFCSLYALTPDHVGSHSEGPGAQRRSSPP